MRNSLLLRLQNQPAALDSLLFGLTEEDVLARPIPDKWSILDNLAHLGRYHEIFTERIGLIIVGDDPAFKRYRAEDDPGFLEWQQKPYTEIMGEFYKSRGLLNNQFAALTPEQLRCTARHPLFGKMNMEGWAELFLLHEAHHFFTIVKLAASVRPERVMGNY